LKYRDRARERRDDSNPDYQNVEQYDVVSVEKSKFLGGDIEHTHLVKGLDYALANKMREETEKREEERLEKEFMEKEKLKVQQQEIPKVEPEKKRNLLCNFFLLWGDHCIELRLNTQPQWDNRWNISFQGG